VLICAKFVKKLFDALYGSNDMDLLPGYRINETLHASARTVVYRARREEDGLVVFLKTFQPGVPVAEAWGRARHEHCRLCRFSVRVRTPFTIQSCTRRNTLCYSA
jgi:hypothetical protein